MVVVKATTIWPAIASRLPAVSEANAVPIGISVPSRPRLGPTFTSTRDPFNVRRTRSSRSRTRCSRPPSANDGLRRSASTSRSRPRSGAGSAARRSASAPSTGPASSHVLRSKPVRSRRRASHSVTHPPAMKTAAPTATQSIAITGKRSTCASANRPFSRVPSRLTGASAACADRRARLRPRPQGLRLDARRAGPRLPQRGSSPRPPASRPPLRERPRHPIPAPRVRPARPHEPRAPQTADRAPRKRLQGRRHRTPADTRATAAGRSRPAPCSTAHLPGRRPAERPATPALLPDERARGRHWPRRSRRSIPDPAGARRCRSGIRPRASARRSGPAPRSRRPLPRARTTVRRHAAANEEAPGQRRVRTVASLYTSAPNDAVDFRNSSGILQNGAHERSLHSIPCRVFRISSSAPPGFRTPAPLS